MYSTKDLHSALHLFLKAKITGKAVDFAPIWNHYWNGAIRELAFHTTDTPNHTKYGNNLASSWKWFIDFGVDVDVFLPSICVLVNIPICLISVTGQQGRESGPKSREAKACVLLDLIYFYLIFLPVVYLKQRGWESANKFRCQKLHNHKHNKRYFILIWSHKYADNKLNWKKYI